MIDRRTATLRSPAVAGKRAVFRYRNDAAREVLGAAAFEAAYERGRSLAYPDALALAQDLAQVRRR